MLDKHLSTQFDSELNGVSSRVMVMIRCGFGEAADLVQELYLAGRKDEAAAAVPDEWVDMKSLVGPPARIMQRYAAWEESGATSLTVRSRQPEAIEVMAQAARLN